MARYTSSFDPFDLQLLRYAKTGRGGLPIVQQDLPARETQLPDGRILRAWTTRPQLVDELYDHVVSVVELPREDPEFPQPGELLTPSFHAHLALPNLTPRDGWEYKSSPEELAERLRRGDGAIMPAAMRHDLYADATLAWYGDLHVDHIGAVFQLEAVRRDIATLRLAQTPESSMASLSHLAILEDHHRTLIADLHARREHTRQRQCSPNELIGAYSAERTQDARLRELRTWPGGDHTKKVIDELDHAFVAVRRKAEKPWTVEHDRDGNDLYDVFHQRTLDLSTDMSRARVQEWADGAKPTAGTSHHPRPNPMMEPTEADDRLHAHKDFVDRGVRHEPAPQPSEPYAPMAQHHPQPRRIDPAPSADEHRRPSM